MRNIRMNKNIYIIGLLLLALLAIMISMVSFEYTNNEAVEAKADSIMASYEVKDGYLYDSSYQIITSGADYEEKPTSSGRYHMTEAKAKATYGASNVTLITDAAGLKEYLASPNSKHAVLMDDISVTLTSESGTEYTKTFDGNGYKITLKPIDADTEMSNYYRNGTLFGEKKAYYYTGLLFGANSGTIKNLTIDLVEASKILNPGATMSSGGTLISNVEGTCVAGVVCGINKSTIENVTLNLIGAFAVGKGAYYGGVFTPNTYLANNSCVVGGICGAHYSGTINRCTLINEGGIVAVADGSKSGAGNKTAASSAGGICGIIRNVSTTTITYCTIAGTGVINALCGNDQSNRNNDGSWGFAGGVTAGCIVYNDNSSTKSYALASGQINGILSAWTGTRTNIWKDSDATFKSLVGSLFDVVDPDTTITDDNYLDSHESISNLVFLFDYNEETNNYPCIDSNMKISTAATSQIYSANSGGTVSVYYDYSKLKLLDGDSLKNKVIRIEAVASGYTASGIDSQAKEKTFDPVSFGGIIWRLTSSTAQDQIVPENKTPAEVRYISMDANSILVYTFGDVGKLYVEDTNISAGTTNVYDSTHKRYDGGNIQMPNWVVKVQNKTDTTKETPATMNSSAYSVTLTYSYNGYERVLTDYSNLNMPGMYTATISKDSYQYYDEENHVLVENSDPVAWEYNIVAFNSLFNASINSSSIKWMQSDTITFNYANAANTIDYYTVKKGNAAAGNKIKMPNTVNATVAVTDSGKYYYTVNAYVVNKYYAIPEYNEATISAFAEGVTYYTKVADNYIEVESTATYDSNTTYYVKNSAFNEETGYISLGSVSVQPYIDNENPTIVGVKYYLYDANAVDYKGNQLMVNELDEWQYDDIIVAYEVKDNNLSGIASGSGHLKYTKVNNSTWNCIAKLTGTESSKVVYYKDAAGNEASLSLSALIDTTRTELTKVKTLNSGEYLSYYAQLGYCAETVKISFTPKFGASGAHLEYSYEVDSNGNDIWHVYEKALKANQPNTFIIDFEIDKLNKSNNPVHTGHFKMRLVSDENLYPDSYANETDTDKTGYVTNGADNYEDSIYWRVKIVIAGIVVKLDNLYYEGASLQGKSAEELNAIFNKTYDSTVKAGSNLYYEGNLKLKARVYSDPANKVVISGTQVIYSELYTYASPKIEEDCLEIDVTYSTANVGNNISVTLKINSIKVDGIGDYYNKYLVRFYTDTITSNLNDLTEKPDKFLETMVITSTASISKATLNVDLNNYSAQLSSSYTYGDAIPSQIIIQGVGGEDIILKVDSDAKITEGEDGKSVYPSAGSYATTASFAVANANYDLNVTGITITISKKQVMVTTKLDGAEYYNTTIPFDGALHELEGTFTDIYGKKDSKAIITYYTDYACTALVSEEEIKGVTTTGTYYGKITIENSNYIVANTGNPVKFTITKGYLDLNLKTQQKSFSGKAQEFDIVTNVEKEYYSSGTFDIKYYNVVDGIADISTDVKNPSKVGTYLVQITFSDCTYFYDKAYEDSYLVITKAATKASADDITIAYDGDIHQYTIESAKFKVTANDGTTGIIVVSEGELNYTIYDGTSTRAATATEIAEVIELRSYDETTRAYKIVDEDNRAEYKAAGEYSFRITFKGDDCFESSSCVVTLTIEPAKFEGLTFESEPYYYVDSSEDNYHSVVMQGELLETYLKMGAVIKYKYLGSNYTDKGDLHININTDAEWTYRLQKNGEDDYTEVIEGTPFRFSNVGEYLMSATISLDNYTSTFIMTTLTIDKSKMPRVTAIFVEAEYDGDFHPAKFTIADHTYEEYYISGYEDVKYLSYIMMGTDRINVRYDDAAAPLDAGDYYGIITLTSDSFATEKIETHVRITQKQIDNVSFDSLDKIISKLDSSTNLSKIYPTFTDALGEKSEANYEYFDLNGNKVELNSDGTLNPGTYIVKISFDDGNYYTTQEAEITIVQASSKGGNKSSDNSSDEEGSGIIDLIKQNLLYVIIGGAALVVIIISVVVVAVVKGKKKKSKKRPKRTPPPTRGAPPQRSAPPTKKPQQSAAPIKKKPNGPQDRATF